MYLSQWYLSDIHDINRTTNYLRTILNASPQNQEESSYFNNWYNSVRNNFCNLII